MMKVFTVYTTLWHEFHIFYRQDEWNFIYIAKEISNNWLEASSVPNN